MSLSFSSKYCLHCEAQTKHERPRCNHLLHLILTCLTGGLWAIIWVGVAVQIGGWRCSICGTKRGLL